jgi:hypothetical protein
MYKSIYYYYYLYNRMSLISESEIDGEHIDVLLKESIKSIQQGLCNVEMSLMYMIEKDEIDAEMWLASHECNITLLNLVKELNEIMKEIRPSSKALKLARGKIDEVIENDKRNN